MKQVLGINSDYFWKKFKKHLFWGFIIGMILASVISYYNEKDWTLFLLVYGIIQGGALLILFESIRQYKIYGKIK